MTNGHAPVVVGQAPVMGGQAAIAHGGLGVGPMAYSPVSQGGQVVVGVPTAGTNIAG